ncbi:hypothetical protein CBR_g30765 [Chara braunii]|uniref:FCP1 homology domain-containing protein n=1 Tax=Chara braunii TaxID=69332 RepID=A0A388JXD6_CHABU|nr:hypothetical protein CBR_g30765 [Chara braunii]|eukprot:GBG62445.1 hypothetical protein CBR_g30765 [Chara braunii]
MKIRRGLVVRPELSSKPDNAKSVIGNLPKRTEGKTTTIMSTTLTNGIGRDPDSKKKKAKSTTKTKTKTQMIAECPLPSPSPSLSPSSGLHTSSCPDSSSWSIPKKRTRKEVVVVVERKTGSSITPSPRPRPATVDPLITSTLRKKRKPSGDVQVLRLDSPLELRNRLEVLTSTTQCNTVSSSTPAPVGAELCHHDHPSCILASAAAVQRLQGKEQQPQVEVVVKAEGEQPSTSITPPPPLTATQRLKKEAEEELKLQQARVAELARQEAAELEAATNHSRREYLLQQLERSLTDDCCAQITKHMVEMILLEHKITSSQFTNWDDRFVRLEHRVDELSAQQSKILDAIQGLSAQLAAAKLITQLPLLQPKPSPPPSQPPSPPPSHAGSAHSSRSSTPSQKASVKATYAAVTAADRGPKIPDPNKFRGDDPKTDVGDWAAGTRAYLRGFVCAEQTKVATVLGLLEGPALKWATSTSSSLQQSMEDWAFGLGVDRLLQALEDPFADKERARKAADRIARLGQQRYSGTLHALFAEFEQVTSTPGLVMAPDDMLTSFCRAAPEKFAVALYSAGYKDWRMFPAELEELRKQLETLTSKGWIRPSTSEFGGPVLFVPKGNGEFRMCIDYRGLNKIARKSTEPLPRIDDLLDMVQGCTVFSRLDLKSGYHQIEMAEEDVYKTTFKTREHAEHLARVPQSLRDSQYKINREKSSFGVPSVIYLGHVISGDGLAPEAAKIAAIQEWPQPQTVRDVRSFMGLASYYRKFVRNFSAAAAPLTNLAKKDTPFLWSLHCQLAFTRLKKALTRAPVMKLPDPTLLFILTIDASQYGIGAVLQQDDGNGLRPVEFMSKKIKTQKLQDSTYEKELYWKHFLLGRHFKISSDHSTLQWMKSQGELNDKLARYIQFIDMFDFELKHKKGCYNKVADALSRRPDSFALISSTHSFGEETRQTIARLLPQDETFGPIVRNLQADPNSEPGYAMSSDLLYTCSRGEERLCIPQDQWLRTLLMSECHDARGHFGFLKSYAALSQRFFWKEMRSEMLRYVDTCELCQRNKVQRKPPLGLLKPLPIPDGPAQSVSIDFTDLGKTTPRGMRQVMVCVDRFSKYAKFIPLPEVARVPAVRADFSESGGSPDVKTGREMENQEISEQESVTSLRHHEVSEPEESLTETGRCHIGQTQLPRSLIIISSQSAVRAPSLTPPPPPPPPPPPLSPSPSPPLPSCPLPPHPAPLPTSPITDTAAWPDVNLKVTVMDTREATGSMMSTSNSDSLSLTAIGKDPRPQDSGENSVPVPSTSGKHSLPAPPATSRHSMPAAGSRESTLRTDSTEPPSSRESTLSDGTARPKPPAGSKRDRTPLPDLMLPTRSKNSTTENTDAVNSMATSTESEAKPKRSSANIVIRCGATVVAKRSSGELSAAVRNSLREGQAVQKTNDAAKGKVARAHKASGCAQSEEKSKSCKTKGYRIGQEKVAKMTQTRRKLDYSSKTGTSRQQQQHQQQKEEEEEEEKKNAAQSAGSEIHGSNLHRDDLSAKSKTQVSDNEVVPEECAAEQPVLSAAPEPEESKGAAGKVRYDDDEATVLPYDDDDEASVLPYEDDDEEEAMLMVAASSPTTVHTEGIDERDGKQGGAAAEEDDELDDFNPYSFIRRLPKLSQVVSQDRPKLLPKRARKSPPISLVLDLDETLVHSTLEICKHADFSFPVNFNNQHHTVYVRRRPHLQAFMERVADLFEIIVFTASQSVYAEQLLNILDPQRKLIRHRIFREACIFVDGNYLKDLSILGRDLAKVAIIDNSPQAFGFQVDNGIPIDSWFDDPSDCALQLILPFLETLVGVDDVRPVIAKQFNLRQKIAAAAR